MDNLKSYIDETLFDKSSVRSRMRGALNDIDYSIARKINGGIVLSIQLILDILWAAKDNLNETKVSEFVDQCYDDGCGNLSLEEAEYVVRFIIENMKSDCIYDVLDAESEEDAANGKEFIDQLTSMGISVLNHNQILKMLFRNDWEMYDVFEYVDGLKTADRATIFGDQMESKWWIVYTNIKGHNKAKVDLADAILNNVY